METNKYNNIPKNATLISYLIAHGVTVPHYCYHEELSIVGNCRMCVIELEKAAKPIVSCVKNALSIIKENNIYPNSVLVQKARENIIEFLPCKNNCTWFTRGNISSVSILSVVLYSFTLFITSL